MAKYPGYKVVMSRNTTGSTYVTVGQVLEIGDVGSSRAQIDVTAYGDSWADYLAGIQEGTELSVRVALDPADSQHIAMKADYDDNVGPKKFHFEHPDHTQGIEITATATSYITRFPTDGAYEAEFGLKIVQPGVTYGPGDTSVSPKRAGVGSQKEISLEDETGKTS